MTDDPLVRNIHLVAVIAHGDDPPDRLYAAAVPRGQAVAAVRSRIAPEWTALLTEDYLTASQVAILGIRSGQVRQVVGLND